MARRRDRLDTAGGADAHTAEMLREAGYSGAEIATLPVEAVI